MDIEERAEKYARHHAPDRLAGIWLTAEQIREVREALTAAYLRGSERTREDYAHGRDR